MAEYDSVTGGDVYDIGRLQVHTSIIQRPVERNPSDEENLQDAAGGLKGGAAKKIVSRGKNLKISLYNRFGPEVSGKPERQPKEYIMSRRNDHGYDETDSKFVRDINDIEGAIGDQRLAGGKRVDEYVRAKGGIQYGEETIESIALHPEMQVCAETLRRWWAYFRLYSQLGKEISAAYPKARARDYYEISRLLGARILTRDGESLEDARKRVILEVASWLGQKRKSGKASCDDVRAMVTKVADAGAAENVIKKTDRASGKPDRRSKAAKTIAFQDIGSAVDYLENFSEPGHLGSGSVPVAALGKQFNRLADTFVRLADHLAHEGDKEEVREKIRSVRCKLDEIETALGSDSITWAEDSDTGVNIPGSHAN